MLTKVVKYTDLNGNEVNETLQFNLTQTEAMEIALELPDTVKKTIGENPEEVSEETATKLLLQLGDSKIFAFVKAVVLKAYGKKSEDGLSFIKLDEDGKPLSTKFAQTLAYDAIMTELMTSNEAAAMDFVHAVLPAGVPKALPTSNN